MLKATNDGAGTFSNANLTAALNWINTNKASYNIVAVNMSLASSTIYNAASAATDATTYGPALTTLAADKSMIVIAAAGNSYDISPMASPPSPRPSGNSLGFAAPGVAFPAVHTGVAAVSASLEQNYPSLNANGWQPESALYPKGLRDQLTNFSNRDPSLTDFVAPGFRVVGAAPKTNSFVPGLVQALSGTSMASPIVTGSVALLQQVARLHLSGNIDATPVAGANRNIWTLLSSTADLITDTPLANSSYTDPATGATAVNPDGTTKRVPTTGATYKRINVLRAAERILQWQYEDRPYNTGTLAGLELNQNGDAKFIYQPTSINDVYKLRFNAPGAKKFKIKIGSPAAGIAPAAILRDTLDTTGAEAATASRGGDTLTPTLSSGLYDLILQPQLAPASGYQSAVSVDGPAPDDNHNHSANQLRDASSSAGAYSGSIGADQKAHYFRFLPAQAAGTIRLELPAGSALQAVVSIYNSKGNLVPGARAVASPGSGVNLAFSGLTPGQLYSVRVGSLNYATTGAFKLYKTYAASGSFEGSGSSGSSTTLATGDITSVMRDALIEAVDSMDRFSDKYMSTADMTRLLPLLNTTLGDITQFKSILQSDIFLPLKAGLLTATTVEQLQTLLQGIAGQTLSIEPASVVATDDGDRTSVNFTVSGSRISEILASVVQTALDSTMKIKDPDGAKVPVESNFIMNLTVSLLKNSTLAPADAATITFNDFHIDLATDALMNAFVAMGLTDAVIADGAVKMQAVLSNIIHGVGQSVATALTPAELDNTPIDDLLTSSTSGPGLTAELPIDLTVGDYTKSDATVTLTDPNPLDSTQPVVTKQNWGDLDLFAGLSASELLSLIRGLRDKVASVINLPAINTVIPFTDGVTVASALHLDDLLATIDGTLSDAEGAAAFVTGGDLVQKVMQALDLPFVTQNYDPATQALSFHIDWQKAISTTLPFRLNVETGPLKLGANADLSLTANADFGITFGIDLTPPGNGLTLGERFFLDDGRLDANIALNATNVGGSATLFNFLGVNATGGSGVASASIGVDLYGGQRVTLSDIGRSIAQGGAAITGANPVPAALSNLNYTGTADITLPNLSVTGISFTPAGTPKIHVTVPDFKLPTAFGVDTAQLGDLLNFQNLSFASLLDAIRSFVTNLKNNVTNSILSKEIPGTGKSIADLIDFINRIATAVEQFQNGDAGTLQQAAQVIEAKLETALGINLTNTLSIAYENVTNKPLVAFQLSASGNSNGSFAFDVDVDSLLNGVPVPGIPSILSSLVDGRAAGTVTYTGAYDFSLGFGAYLQSPTTVVPYVTDSSHLDLSAYANANNTLQAEFGVGPVSLYVVNGTVKLSETTANTNPAKFAVGLPPRSDHRIPISELPTLFGGSNLNSRITLNGAVNVSLPMFGPTQGTPLPGIGGGNNIFTASITSLSNLLRGVAGSATMYSPDIASLITGFNFTAGIGSMLRGLDTLLAQLSDLVQGQLFGIDLPVVDKSLKNSAPTKLIETIRQKIQLAAVTPQSAVTAVRTELINALIAAGISSPVVNYTAFLANGTSQGTNVPVTADTADIRFTITAAKTLSANVPIAFDLGIPGLSLDLTSTNNTTDPTLALDVNWNINLKFGVSLADGFYIDTTTSNEVTADVFVSFGNGVSFGGELGFLRAAPPRRRSPPPRSAVDRSPAPSSAPASAPTSRRRPRTTGRSPTTTSPRATSSPRRTFWTTRSTPGRRWTWAFRSKPRSRPRVCPRCPSC
ncbi:MAG: S8 family serine peptidase [Tepidisphaeraceae bacterium]